MSAQRRWTIGAAIAAFVILVAGWFLLVKPQKAKVTDLHEQTAAQTATNQQLLTKISALQAQAKNNAQEQRILEKFASQIPDAVDEPSLLRSLSATAKGAGVDLVSVTPGSPSQVGSSGATATLGSAAPSGALFTLPLTLSVTGAYANVESFFAGVEHLPRAFRVSDFTVTPAAGNGVGALAPNSLTASITTAVFYSTPSTTATTAAPSTGTGDQTTPSAASTDNPAAPAVDKARQGAGEVS
jgi:Tfp pilus assembly protein PilO